MTVARSREARAAVFGGTIATLGPILWYFGFLVGPLLLIVGGVVCGHFAAAGVRGGVRVAITRVLPPFVVLATLLSVLWIWILVGLSDSFGSNPHPTTYLVSSAELVFLPLAAFFTPFAIGSAIGGYFRGTANGPMDSNEA